MPVIVARDFDYSKPGFQIYNLKSFIIEIIVDK